MPGTWNALEVLEHLVHAERTNWVPRIQLLLEHGDARAFDPFDRVPPSRDGRTPPLVDLLAEFAAVRRDSLDLLRNLELRDLDRPGRHPDFGPVTLRQLIAAWVVHDLDHMMQIARVMARRLTDAVGPWREYLRIVRDVPRPT